MSVVWDDAWTNSDNFVSLELQHRPLRLVSVGIKIRYDDVGITIARDLHPEDGGFRDTLFIPKEIIREVVEHGAIQI